MREQKQFLQALDRDEAERRFGAAVNAPHRGIEMVPLEAARGSVLPTERLGMHP